MDRMKTFFKYFIIVLAFYIFTNIITNHIFPVQKAQANNGESSISVDYELEWEELSNDPMFWFIMLGGLIVTLP